jgi:hypothetical protein
MPLEPNAVTSSPPPAARRTSTRVFAAALAVCGAVIAIVAWHGGVAVRVGGDDLYGMYLGKHHYVAETLRAGRLPLWNPFEYCGLPLLGTAQGSVFYLPLILANVVLVPWSAMQLLYALHALVLVWTLLTYATRSGLPVGIAVIAPLVALAGLVTSAAGAAVDHPHLMFETCLVPAVLLLWDAVLDGSRWAFPGLAALLAVQWLPGYPEPSLDTLVLLGTLAVLDDRGRLLHRVGLAAAAGALGAAAAAVQLLPLAEAARESVRTVDAGDYARLRSFFAPSSPVDAVLLLLRRYGGATIVAMLFGTLAPGRPRRLWLAGLLWCLLATAWPFRLLYVIWPFSTLRFAWGWNCIAPIFVGLLAARGLHLLARQSIPPILGPLLAVALAIVALAHGLYTAAGTALLAGALPIVVARKRPQVWVVGAALIACAAAAILAMPDASLRWDAPDLAALAPRAALLSQWTREAGVRAIAPAEITAGLALADHIRTPMGAEAAVPPRRIERVLLRLGLPGLLDRLFPRKSFDRFVPFPQVASVLGVGFVVAPPYAAGGLEQAGYRVVHRFTDGDSVLFRQPAPRFRLLHAVRIVDDEEAAFAEIFSSSYEPTRHAVIERADAAVPLAEPTGAGDTIRVLRDEPEAIDVQTNSSAAALLVIGDNHYPGWSVLVDGRPERLLRVDYTFRGVPVPAGEHRVQLRYDPPGVRLGALISLCAMVAIAVAGWLPGRLLRAAP